MHESETHINEFAGLIVLVLMLLGVAATILLVNKTDYQSPSARVVTVATGTPLGAGRSGTAALVRAEGTSTEEILSERENLPEYIVVTDGCDIHFEGACVNVRSGPGTDYPVVAQLRNNVLLKVGGEVKQGDHTWYKIAFDEPIRYPERVTGDWYVAADYVTLIHADGVHYLNADTPTTTKRIIVDRGKQMLYAYDGDTLFMQTPISTGLELTPTPRGTFTVFKKTPSRYMQGPLPGISDQYYDLPGVPWNLYFTEQGAVIHGAYWHNSFGHPYSHGCVNLPPDQAKKLYDWAPLGTTVTVRD